MNEQFTNIEYLKLSKEGEKYIVKHMQAEFNTQILTILNKTFDQHHCICEFQGKHYSPNFADNDCMFITCDDSAVLREYLTIQMENLMKTEA